MMISPVQVHHRCFIIYILYCSALGSGFRLSQEYGPPDAKNGKSASKAARLLNQKFLTLDGLIASETSFSQTFTMLALWTVAVSNSFYNFFKLIISHCNPFNTQIDQLHESEKEGMEILIYFCHIQCLQQIATPRMLSRRD